MTNPVTLASPVATTPLRTVHGPGKVEIADGRYAVKLAETSLEVESALRLRYEVFRVEMVGKAAPAKATGLEFDDHDFSCRHLLVIDNLSGQTVGTYRLNSIESARVTSGFYSHSEFSIEDLPSEVLTSGVEIGRACVAREHRNTKVLFLLWKGLAAFLQVAGKRFFFGCCSIFTRDPAIGEQVYRQLADDGYFHNAFQVEPRKNALYTAPTYLQDKRVELPNLFNMYLRIGAKVCGPPTIDHDFGTIDFFVVCDTETINEKYRRMFFS